MSLAELFAIKETFRQQIHRWRRARLRRRVSSSPITHHSSPVAASRFILESLEPRLLLSATPTEVVAPQEAPVTQAEVTPSADPILTIADATVVESNTTFSPNMQFGVTLSQAAATDVVVAYQTIRGTATEEFDFNQTVGTLTIVAGQTSGTITITTFGGTEVEADEYFVVELTNVQGATFADGALRARAIGTMQDNDGAGNKLGLFVDDAQVVEGATGTKEALFRVRLSQAPASVITLNYTTVNGSATAGQDYTATSGTLTFNPGETVKTVAVAVSGDLTIEGSETFSLVVTPTAAIGNGAAGAAGVATIMDDDAGGGTVPVLSLADAEVLESNTTFSSNMEFVVTLSAPSTTGVTVAYQTVNGTATEEVDFDQTVGTLTIAAGQTSGRITITTFGGTEIEPDEYLYLELTNVQGAAFAGGGRSLWATGAMLDNDGSGNKRALFVEDIQHVETDSGTHQAVFYVRLSQPSDTAMTLSYSTQDGSALAGQDYTATSGTLTFNPGETLKAVTVPIVGDLTIEGDETFALVVTPTAAIGNGAAGAAGVATIMDDDAGGGTVPVLSLADAEVQESNTTFSANMEFVVTLSSVAATDVMVAYQTIRGTATEEFDFNQTVGTLTIAAGQTSGRITITTFGGTEIEPDEYLYLELTNVQGAVFAGGARSLRATGAMLDNDGSGNKRALFVDDIQRVETNTGSQAAVFYVRLSQPSDAAITLSYSTQDGSALAGQDYTATSGTVTFAPGETLKAVAVAVFGDLTSEGSETFSLVVTPTVAIGNGAAGAAGIATILDDDAGGGTLPVLSLADAEVQESNTTFSANMEFVVTLSSVAATDVTVAYQTISGTATEEFDFDQTVGTLTIAAGQTSGRITITTFGGTEIEPDEYLYLELTNVQGAVLAGGGPSLRATGVLLDNDRGDIRPSLFVEDAQVVEGVAGGQRLLTFNVHLSQPTTDTVTVAYTTAPGTASSGSDYTPKQGTLTFAPGQTSAAVQIPIIGDNTTEASERFSLILSAPQGTPMASGGAGLAALATILDDDAGGGLVPVISITDVEVVESNTTFSANMEFVLTLSAPTTSTVTVNYQTLNGTATAGQDYTAVATPVTVTFQPGQTSARVTITALGGTVVEPDESFFLQLSSPQNAALAGGVATLQGTGTIRDNDSPAPVPGLPVLTVQDLTVQEQVGGSTATFTLSLPTPAGLTITGTFTILPGTATAGADFTASTGTFTMLAGATATTVSVPIHNDNLVELIETVVLQLTLPQNAQFTNASSALYAITRIVDNDFVLDVDGNGIADALTDGILIIRYLFGFTGDALINGVVDLTGARNSAQLVEEFLAHISDRLDVDGNGVADALTDGILIIRFLFGFTGDSLINGVVDPTGTRTTAAAIEAFLQGFLPGSTPTVSEAVVASPTSESPTIVVSDSAAPAAELGLAYVQRSWVKDFVAESAAATDGEEEELLIALPA